MRMSAAHLGAALPAGSHLTRSPCRRSIQPSGATQEHGGVLTAGIALFVNLDEDDCGRSARAVSGVVLADCR